MHQSLELKVSQQLVMTPQLQQSLRLLHSSAIELLTEIRQAVQDNPMLELYDEYEESIGSTDNHDELALLESSLETNWAVSSVDDSSTDYMMEMECAVSLRMYLLEQLSLLRVSEVCRQRVAYLIDNLDDNGYLVDSLEQLSQDFALSIASDGQRDLSNDMSASPEDESLGHTEVPGVESDDELPESDEWLIALRLLQSFDPIGVGARSLSECLVLQLKNMRLDRRLEHLSSVGSDLVHENGLTNDKRVDMDAIVKCALQICQHGLEALATAKIEVLQAISGAPTTIIKQAHRLIQHLDPRPGREWTSQEADYIIPDIVVRKVSANWSLFINPEVRPKLRINYNYEHLLTLVCKNEADSMHQQLSQARQLIRQVSHRFATILSVAQTIMLHQQTFLEQGESALKPLTLRDVAIALGVHESTVSRAAAQKYIATPYGIFELNYFFSKALQAEGGEQVSTKVIQTYIQELVQNEPVEKPLSDAKISELLSGKGLFVARRTVAKYREQLNIATASIRRAQAKLR